MNITPSQLAALKIADGRYCDDVDGRITLGYQDGTTTKEEAITLLEQFEEQGGQAELVAELKSLLSNEQICWPIVLSNQEGFKDIDEKHRNWALFADSNHDGTLDQDEFNSALNRDYEDLYLDVDSNNNNDCNKLQRISQRHQNVANALGLKQPTYAEYKK